jgi:hypothetical protein
MSHYTRLSTKITRKSALVKALIAMGFKEHQIEVFDKPEKLRGYAGDYRGQQGEVRIKGYGWGHEQNAVGGMSNDLGWELQKDGTYAFHCSDYDSSKYNKSWIDKLNDQYAKAVVHEIADEHNYVIESETEENGEIFIKLTYPW